MKDVRDNDYTTLLFDFNNLAIRNFFGCKEITEDLSNIPWNLWKYNVFNSIYATICKFRDVEEVILAIDDTNSWRKSFYKRYKESRKEKKKESKIDWSELYTMMNSLISELKHYMPFKVIKVKSAEADDIIGVLVKKFKNKCVIIARDEDYFQCFGRNKNLVIYDPISQKKYTKEDFPDVKKFLMKLIFCGQAKDDIPNIITPNDWGLTESTKGKKRPGFGEKSFEKIQDDVKNFIDNGYKNKYYGEVNLRENLRRNRILIDFDKIPNTVVDRILSAYNRSHNLPPLNNIYLWFEKYQMRSFIEDVHNITNRLQVLY